VAAWIFRCLLGALAPYGPIRVEPKATCLHLCGRKSAFAGVHPRRNGVLLTIRTAAPIDSPRVRRSERASANRAHNDILLSDPSQVDDELAAWLSEGLKLSGGPVAEKKRGRGVERGHARD
jgi:hypothetical protein